MFALEKHTSAVWDTEASSLNKEASQLEGYREFWVCLSSNTIKLSGETSEIEKEASAVCC